MKGFTEGLQRRLRRLNIGFVPKRRETLYTNLCKLKTKVDFNDCKDVVYSIPCKECGLRYIGETSQHFCDRVGQHQRDIRNRKMSNGFYAHIRRNRGHTVEWRDAVFIDKEKHWKGRNIKEALYINAQNPKKTVDKSRILNLEKGLYLDLRWGDFNDVFRRIISKRVQRTV